MLSHNTSTPRSRLTEALCEHVSPQSRWQGTKTGPLTYWLLQLPPGSAALHFHSVHWPKQDTQLRPQGGQESAACHVSRGGETERSAQELGDHRQASSREGCHSLYEMLTGNRGER